MDKYAVKLLTRALRDLNGIYVYIAKTLLAPDTAVKLVEDIEETIFRLEKLPYRARNEESARMPIEATGSYSSRATRVRKRGNLNHQFMYTGGQSPPEQAQKRPLGNHGWVQRQVFTAGSGIFLQN